MTSCAEDPDNEVDNSITLFAGQDAIIEVLVKDALGNLQDLTNAPGYATARMRFADLDVIFYKRNTFAGGTDLQLLILDQTIPANLGKAHVFVNSDEIDYKAVDPKKGPFSWDCWFIIGGLHMPAITPSNLVIKPSVTRFR